MLTRALLAAAIAVSGSLATIAVLAETPPSATTDTTVQIGKVSEWIGREVTDQQGNSVGDIADFAVNLNNATIPFVVIRLGGMFNAKNIAVPLSALRALPGDDSTVSLAVPTSEWKSAKTFDNTSWPLTAAVSATASQVPNRQTTTADQPNGDAATTDLDREFELLDRDGDGYLNATSPARWRRAGLWSHFPCARLLFHPPAVLSVSMTGPILVCQGGTGSGDTIAHRR